MMWAKIIEEKVQKGYICIKVTKTASFQEGFKEHWNNLENIEPQRNKCLSLFP